MAASAGYWRWAGRHLRGAFPTLPARAQFNRLLRAAQNDLARFAVALAEVLGAAFAAYEALDSTGAATRHAKRRGEGWLWGQADIGHSNALGWFEGLRVLAACTPEGVITGFCVAAASCHDAPLAEDFLSARHAGGQGILPTVGAPAAGPYAADKGLEGRERHARWKERLGVQMWCAPKRHRHQAVHPCVPWKASAPCFMRSSRKTPARKGRPVKVIVCLRMQSPVVFSSLLPEAGSFKNQEPRFKEDLRFKI